MNIYEQCIDPHFIASASSTPEAGAPVASGAAATAIPAIVGAVATSAAVAAANLLS